MKGSSGHFLRSIKNSIFIKFNPFPNMPWSFACLKYMPFENTEGKGKIAVKSNFSFYLCAFYPFGALSTIFIMFEIVVC